MASQSGLFLVAVALLSVISCAHSTLTKQEEDDVLAAHNTARAIASPNPCSPLPQLTWSTELAKVAQSYSELCQGYHNDKRTSNQNTFRYVGENLYFSFGTTPNPVKGVQAWDEEKKDYTLANQTCTPNKQCGHYTQVVWNGTTHVGCGAHVCAPGTIKGLGTFGSGRPVYLLTCNYGPGGNLNYRGKHIPPFVSCPKNPSTHSDGHLARTPLSQPTLCVVLIIVAAITYVSM